MPVLGVEFDGGPKRKNVYSQVHYLPSEGEDQLTPFVVILALGHPVEACGGGVGPSISRHLGAIVVSTIWQLTVVEEH